MNSYQIQRSFTAAALSIALLQLQAPLNAKVECEAKVRGSAFIATGDLFRDIYGTAAGNFDAEFAVKVCNYLQAWVNIDYMQAHGTSLGFCNPSSIWITNGSFGLKSPYDFTDWLTGYLGLGPTFGGIRIRDASQFSGCSTCTKSSIGFVAKSGLDFSFC